MNADPPAPWLLKLNPDEPKAPPTALPADTLGLALSGGGIRSAAFGLGLIQALARAGWLRRVDFLSTVSGGGYIGAFLGRFFDLCAKRDGLTGAVPDATPGAGQARVTRDLIDSGSAPITWLRRNANYLSPTGLGEAVTNVAGFWRNLLSIYLVLALFLFATFGVLNAAWYWTPHGTVAAVLGDLVAALTPVTSHLMVRVGPWSAVAELVLWAAVVPLMVAYWLVSEDQPEAFIAPVLLTAAVLAVGGLVATGMVLGVAVLAFAVLWVLGVWFAVRRAEGHRDPLNPFRLLLARNRLTRWLAFWLGAGAALAVIALIDGLGRWLAWRMLEGGLTVPNVGGWVASVASGVFGVATGLRLAVRFLAAQAPARSVLVGLTRPYLVAALVFLLGVVPPLAALAFASHAAYELGSAYTQGLVATGVALGASLLLGTRECLPFINRSGPLGIYAGRLARAFLGAVNPARRTHPDGRKVTNLVPGDDVPFGEYAPHAAGGPLHILNCAVNETVDVASQRGLRDRQAENMAVGPAGVNIARQWHALWCPVPSGRPALCPVAAPGEASPHPFLAAGDGPVEVEPLDLRQWVAISGAAIGPGMGPRTSFARALLLTLANLRLGYWWDSGLNAGERQSVPLDRGPWRRFLAWFSTRFQAQALLLAELSGRFAGPWERYWNLSDGGNFENTGAYELLRRRVPFVIVCDAGADPEHQGADLARLVRLARVDLGAEFEAADAGAPGPLAALVPPEAARHLGALGDLLTPPGGPSRRHAVLYRVRYPDGPPNPSGDPWLNRTHTWLLYIKATLVGDEPADVRSYAAAHPDFPNESTLNQVFDEPQWESYRKLGALIGQKLFV